MCDGCGTGPSQQGYCPDFVGCQSCINRPGMMSFATRGLTCGLLPHMGRFYRGQSTTCPQPFVTREKHP